MKGHFQHLTVLCLLPGHDENHTDIPDWMRDQSEQQQAQQRQHLEAQRTERLQKAKAKLSQNRGIFGSHKYNHGPSKAAKHVAKQNGKTAAVPDEEEPLTAAEHGFLLDEWNSDSEDGGSKRKAAE